ncbi:MAG: cisplatin damage response ATP-dependent DNA ligase [Hyphomicrobiaceae bacterium]|nr:cisplatin damage response ATP-dependent DNA ligase [Hyphomicrobiaceae bacterium]
MKAFAGLLDRLVYTPQRNAKLRLMVDYLRATPDPDRGFALAALTDGLAVRLPVRRTIAELMKRRFDAELFRMSRDYVGDTAETVALVWPAPSGGETSGREPLHLRDVAQAIRTMDRSDLAARLEAWLDRLDAVERWALLKLLTGALRVGVSARLAKTAVAELGGRPVSDIEEVWHGLEAPYHGLLAWLEGTGPRPDPAGAPVFRPPMLAHPIEPSEWATLDLAEYAVEWKWDGIRVQLAAGRNEARLYSRTGDDIGHSFPEILAGATEEAVLDGELLVVREGVVAPFNDLQQRLNRRQVTRRMLADFPAHLRLYDALMLEGEDLRPLPLLERRRRLEAWHAHYRPPLTDLSEQVAVADKATLDALWSGTRAAGIEGLMLKRWQSPYIAGRPKGHWLKWKRAPLSIDCVLMYAQRGSGKRSSFYSDYTFGLWTEDPQGQPALVPVGKAYSGYSDAELVRLDRWIRGHTTERFGPVRAVEPGLVLEVLFDAVQRSPRHKSGIAMRFPRIARIRWDKPAAEADRLSSLSNLLSDPG